MVLENGIIEIDQSTVFYTGTSVVGLAERDFALRHCSILIHQTTATTPTPEMWLISAEKDEHDYSLFHSRFNRFVQAIKTNSGHHNDEEADKVALFKDYLDSNKSSLHGAKSVKVVDFILPMKSNVYGTNWKIDKRHTSMCMYCGEKRSSGQLYWNNDTGYLNCRVCVDKDARQQDLNNLPDISSMTTKEIQDSIASDEHTYNARILSKSSLLASYLSYSPEDRKGEGARHITWMTINANNAENKQLSSVSILLFHRHLDIKPWNEIEIDAINDWNVIVYENWEEPCSIVLTSDGEETQFHSFRFDKTVNDRFQLMKAILEEKSGEIGFQFETRFQ